MINWRHFTEYELLLKMVKFGQSVFIQGPQYSGKSTLAKELIESLNDQEKFKGII